MSKQDEKYMALASHYATLSEMRSHHGSVIVLHGAVMGWGYNHTRNYSRDKLIDHPMSCHAEISALRNIVKRLKLDPVKDRHIFRKMHVYIARRGLNDVYIDSKPCSQCFDTLTDLGVKHIMYSGINTFCNTDVRDCRPSSGYKSTVPKYPIKLKNKIIT